MADELDGLDLEGLANFLGKGIRDLDMFKQARAALNGLLTIKERRNALNADVAKAEQRLSMAGDELGRLSAEIVARKDRAEQAYAARVAEMDREYADRRSGYQQQILVLETQTQALDEALTQARTEHEASMRALRGERQVLSQQVEALQNTLHTLRDQVAGITG